VKTLHFASILLLAAATTFACRDDDDRLPGSAGSSGAAGKNGSAGNASAGKNNGTAGSSAGKAGSGNDAGATNDGGVGGGGGATAAGENEGGGAGRDGGGAGGTSDGAAGGEGGAGGAPEVPDVVVAGPTELIGTWNGPFNTVEVITANTWSGANIVAYTSGVTVVYTHTPASDPYNPKKFSKYVYTQPVGDTFYFCQIVYDAATLEAAQADTKVADVNDLAADGHGCSGFPWSKVTKQ